MSGGDVVLHVRIVCDHDGCDAVRIGEPGTTWPRLRRKLRAVGWYCVGFKDFCPEHRPC